MNLVRLVILYLSLTSDGVRVGKHLSDLFPIKNGLEKKKQKGDGLSPLLCNFYLDYPNRRVQPNKDGFKLKSTL